MPPGACVSGCIDTHDICSEAKNCGHAFSIYDVDFLKILMTLNENLNAYDIQY